MYALVSEHKRQISLDL